MNNLHKNAGTTSHTRMLMIKKVWEGMKVSQVAEGLGVSRRTVYKWLARYRQGREDALHNLSSSPPWKPLAPSHGCQKLGRIVGHRITGDRSRLQRSAGWKYLHVCADDP